MPVELSAGADYPTVNCFTVPAAECCLIFASKGIGTGAIRFGVNVEQAMLQSFQGGQAGPT
jgi:hypothetical protein